MLNRAVTVVLARPKSYPLVPRRTNTIIDQFLRFSSADLIGHYYSIRLRVTNVLEAVLYFSAHAHGLVEREVDDDGACVIRHE